MEDLLYRGINQQQYELLLDTQILKPKGDEFAMVHVADGTFKYDGSTTYGKSQQNSNAGHQMDSDRFKTAGISTTPLWHRAIFYALNGLRNNHGYILFFEKSILSSNGIELFIVKDFIPAPKIPDDDEVILRSTVNRPISIKCITRIEKIIRGIVWP